MLGRGQNIESAPLSPLVSGRNTGSNPKAIHLEVAMWSMLRGYVIFGVDVALETRFGVFARSGHAALLGDLQM